MPHRSQPRSSAHSAYSSAPFDTTSPGDIPAVGEAELCGVRCVHPETVSGARALLASDTTYREVAALFGALADPTRVKLVHLLLSQELCTCDLAAALGISDPAVSQHLRILRALHIVTSRRQGKYVYYHLDDEHVALLMQLGLTHRGHAITPSPSTTVAQPDGTQPYDPAARQGAHV